MDILKEMKVEKVEENKEEITVITTGAKYIIDKSGKTGKISSYQLLNKERLLATINFNYSFSTLSVERKDDSTCVLHQEVGGGGAYLRLQINSDSLLDIYSCKELNLSFSGNFLSDYRAEKNGNILLIDEDGGIGIYPYKGLKNIESVNLSSKEWKIKYILDNWSRILVSVFPPRKFNYTQSFKERVTHHSSWTNPYPSDKMIEAAGKYTNVLVLHSMIWQGKYTRKGKALKTREDSYSDASFCCFDYLPVDEKELIRVIKKAHSLKMKIIPYMSPFYSMAKGRDFLDRVEDVLRKYEMDGVYFDGISSDILYSYRMIQDTRKLLGDKILYVHCTSDPLMSPNIYCPFIDTYADYILRAEHIKSFTNEYLRYVISGYNISNTIGYICYYDYPLDFIKKLIDRVLFVNARFYLGLPIGEREKLLMDNYFPDLERQRRKR